jgi:hypothetical protein
MRVLVLVPSNSHRETAGARIRYGRLSGPLAERDVMLELFDIDRFNADEINSDFLLISKCHDARAPFAALAAQRRGIPVGVDLFDDYFSQVHDARLVRFRHWLSEISPLLSYVLTSTPAMGAIAASYVPHAPALVVNDPADPRYGPTGAGAADNVQAKLVRAQSEQQLDFAWFGIGDNPYFPVGLSDIAAWSAELAVLAQLTKTAVRLTVLTNSRALTPSALAQLAALPFRVNVEMWSEEAEAELLYRSFACFLPVNAQPFSMAKSLNRAITALSHGTQILSPGFPLYDRLGPFIYRDVRSMAVDYHDKRMLVSAERHAELMASLDEHASAEVEADRLVDFFAKLSVGEANVTSGAALVHGAGTSASIGTFARDMRDLVVSSPFAPPGIDADVKTEVSLPLTVEITKPGRSVDSALNLFEAPLSVQLALYPDVVRRVGDRLTSEFGVERTILAENSPVPYLAGCRGTVQ